MTKKKPLKPKNAAVTSGSNNTNKRSSVVNPKNRSMSLACKMAWTGDEHTKSKNVPAAGSNKLVNRRKKKAPLVFSTKNATSVVAKKKK